MLSKPPKMIKRIHVTTYLYMKSLFGSTDVHKREIQLTYFIKFKIK